MFLETYTVFGNPVLVPIDRIKFINLSYKNSYELSIVSDDGNWIECYDQSDEANARFNEIKNFLKVKNSKFV